MSIIKVMHPVIGKLVKSTDEALGLHLLKWLEYVLPMPSYRLPQSAIFDCLSVHLRKLRVNETKHRNNPQC